MKQLETLFDSKKTHKAIMWISLLYGGFAIIFFLLDIYATIWMGGSFFESRDQNRIFEQNDLNTSTNTNVTLIDGNIRAPGPRPQMNPMRTITSPASILLLMSGIISILSGIIIMRITKKNEIKAVKQEAADYLLLPEEKKVIEVLKKNDYSLPQNKITRESGLTKVQVHRVLKRLETKGLIEKHEYGLTNKIVLKKEFFE